MKPGSRRVFHFESRFFSIKPAPSGLSYLGAPFFEENAMKTKSAALAYPMSIAQVAAVVGVGADTIRYYERAGYVSPIRFGMRRTRLYLPEHVDAIRAYRARHGLG